VLRSRKREARRVQPVADREIIRHGRLVNQALRGLVQTMC
jgi:hypothetical protein